MSNLTIAEIRNKEHVQLVIKTIYVIHTDSKIYLLLHFSVKMEEPSVHENGENLPGSDVKSGGWTSVIFPTSFVSSRPQ